MSEIRCHWQTVAGAMIGVAFGPTGIVFYTLSLFVLPLTQAFGWSRAQVSGSALCLQAGLIMMSPVVGLLSDRFGPRHVGLLSMAGLAMALGSLSLIGDNILIFYAMWVLLALFASGGTSIVWSHAVNSCFDKQRGLALGICLSGTGIIATFSPTVVGGIISEFGWRFAYISMAAVIVFFAMPSVAYLLRNHRDITATAGARQMTGDTLREAVATGWFWRSAIIFFFLAGGLAAPITQLAPILLDVGSSNRQMGLIAGLLGVTIVFGRVSIGVLLDRYPPALVGMVVLLLPAIGCVLLVNQIVIPGVILLGVATGAEVDLFAYLVSKRFGLRHYGSIYGWQLGAMMAGPGISAILMGAAYDRWGSYHFALYVDAIVLALGALGVGTLGVRRQQGVNEPLNRVEDHAGATYDRRVEPGR